LNDVHNGILINHKILIHLRNNDMSFVEPAMPGYFLAVGRNVWPVLGPLVSRYWFSVTT
jgi:hypothetical protein